MLAMHKAGDPFWSWARRNRLAFLTAGASGIVLYGILNAADVVTSPSYLTEVIQVWEKLLGPATGPSAGTERAYKLDIKYPSEMFIENDHPITVSVSDVAAVHKGDPNARIHITLTSQSFKFNPEGGISVTLNDDQKADFIATATKLGERSIRVVDQFWITDAPDFREKPFPASGKNESAPRMPNAADVRTITIKVRERPVFLIFDRAIMKDAQIIAATVGIPGLLVFFLSVWRDRRTARKERAREDIERRVIGLPANSRKSIKIER